MSKPFSARTGSNKMKRTEIQMSPSKLPSGEWHQFTQKLSYPNKKDGAQRDESLFQGKSSLLEIVESLGGLNTIHLW